MSINTKELCKQIKYASKRNLIWAVNNGFNYITNRHWMARYDTLPREVLVSLFSAFAEIPKDGETFSISPYSIGDFDRKEPLKVDKIYDSFNQAKSGEVTPFLKDDGYTEPLRVINSQGNLIYISNGYIKMIEDVDASKTMCTSSFQPVFFFDGQLVLLPYRVPASKEDEVIKELVSVVGF